MKYSDRIIKAIAEGKEGTSLGIPFGLSRLSRYIGGIRKKRYYLLGSGTGIGKTAIIDYMLISAILEIIEGKSKKKLKVFYYSLEIDINSKLVKWASLLLYIKKKVIVDPDEILSAIFDENDKQVIISKELENNINEIKSYIDIIEDSIEIHDYPINPTGIHKYVRDYCDSVGHTEKVIVTVEGKEKEVNIYKPDNPDEIVCFVVDHYGLLRNEQQFSKKQNIDKLDEYCISLRNIYGVSPILISQFNRDLEDITRQKFKEVTPTLADFKETGNTQESADIVMSPFYPARYNIHEYRGYNLDNKNNHVFRYLYILKNRGKKDGVGIPLRFLGECGYFEELPDNPQLTPIIYDKLTDWSDSINNLIKIK